jgi:YHS domain-containing protein
MARKIKTATVVQDVVCGKDVDPEVAMYSSNYQGKTYYFCSDMCKKQFDEDPELFVTSAVS